MDSPEIILHLLDGSQSVPVQTWKFKGQPAIRIGRSDDNDVIIRQPMVSRRHAALHWQGSNWALANESRLGTLVAGASAEKVDLLEGDRFQLGAMGPVLSIHSQHVPAHNSLGTITLDSLSHRDTDHENTTEQVDAITKTDFFRNLQELAKKIKTSESNTP